MTDREFEKLAQRVVDIINAYTTLMAQGKYKEAKVVLKANK